MKAKKPTATSKFHFISSFVWQQSPKSQFLAENHHQKLHLFVDRLFFRQKIDVKIESLHLQQFSRPCLGIFFRWTCFSNFLRARIARSSSHGLLRQTDKLLYDPVNGFCLSKFPHYPVHKLDLSCASQHAQKVITLSIFGHSLLMWNNCYLLAM